LLNSSLVPIARFETGTGNSSGFAFQDTAALRTTAPNSSAPGVIQRVNLIDGSGIKPTRMSEAPVLGSTGSAFTRSLAPLYSRNFIVNLTTSGFTVLPSGYDAAVATPKILRVVSAADGSNSVAPGGLISIFGNDLSPTNLATKEIPVPTALGDSCLTVNGLPLPLIFVSPNQINAQLPFQTIGNTTLIVRTPGGVSDNFNFTALPGAPAVFRTGIAGPYDDLPTIVRATNGILATDSNPVHRDDMLTIYLTGLGQVTPSVESGFPAPMDPLAETLNKPVITLGGQSLPVHYAGLAPGEVGVYQINLSVPRNVPLGLGIPLVINQNGTSTTVPVRVVD
jgi:uncharacterized protein (TIGR03437 family)